MIKSAALFYNPLRDGIIEVLLQAAEKLHELKLQVYLPTQYEISDLPTYIKRANRDECIAIADIAVVIGGDGSILRIAEQCAKASVPIIAVDMGTLGFMCELAPNEISLFSRIVDGQFRLDRRMMIEARVMRDGECVYSGNALNDVVINRGAGCKILDLDISADNQFITKLRSDGVIVATPTGSTAYSMAAGGPIVEPGEYNMTITPICAHGLYAKSFVLAPQRTVTINVNVAASHVALISVDGRSGFQLMHGDTVKIANSLYTTDLISIKGKSVYDVIRDKLNYGI